MTDTIGYKTEITAYSKPDGSTREPINSESEKPIGSTEETVEKDSLRYITKLIDNIEAFNKNLDLQTKKKEQPIAQELRREESQ